jgi:lactate 2-monooxygenase
MIKALDRQRTIFLHGLAGKRPIVPFHADKLRAAAKAKMSTRAWAYIDGGAGNEESIQSNTSTFSRVFIRPTMMNPNDTADFSSTLLGTPLAFPLLLAPIGVLDLISPQGDLHVARQCAETGVPFIFSNQAGTPMETCARAMGETPCWMQLYWSRSDELVFSFVKRAEAAGCRALVLTVDTTMLGWRSRDLELGYLPFLRGMGIAQYTSDPVFLDLLRRGAAQTGSADETRGASGPKPAITPATITALLELKRNYPGGFWKNLRSKEPLAAVRLFTNIYTNPALSWDKLRLLRTRTQLPILVKGILRAEDAIKAKDSGADGIIISNHGGRQIDGVLPTLQTLPAIRKALPKPFPILLDSGIRSGSDCFKALALGADAVLLGRPYAYGLAIDRHRGVRETILNLLNDFELTARLAGCRNLGEIDADKVIAAQ